MPQAACQTTGNPVKWPRCFPGPFSTVPPTDRSVSIIGVSPSTSRRSGFASAWPRDAQLRALEQLLFDDAPRTPAPRRTLIPVIAWLCNGNDRWNDAVRSWVQRGAPEIHLEYGDAEALPLEFKRALLTAWIERNRGREEVWSRYSPDAMRRLADQRLAPDVSRFLGNEGTPGDIRELLVQLVRYGSMTACLPDLLAILGNPEEPEDLKTYVLAALRDMGTPDSHRQAWEILRAAPALTNQMRSVACEAFYPGTIGPAEIALLLEKPRCARSTPEAFNMPFNGCWKNVSLLNMPAA